VLGSLAILIMAIRPPRLHLPYEPGQFGLAVEDVRITADDGIRLAAWLVPRPGRPAVVLLHGYPADKRDMLGLAAHLHGRFAVLLVDQRHFGESEGRVTTLGQRERRDLRRVVDWLAARGTEPVGVFGLSMGGAVALMAAAEDPRIRAVVAVAPFADLRRLARDLYGFLWVAKYPLVELTVLWGRLLLGEDLTRPSPVELGARLRIPVLLVHNRADEQIGFHHAEAWRAALAGNPRARFHFPDAGHHQELPAGLPALVDAFFAEHLAAPGR
jgi:pimeloyl-ACP methyl ester carboxylesterase